MAFSDVAVVILNYKSWKETLEEAKLVHDLFELEWRQIIIVDNASPNESQQELSKKEIGDYIFLKSDNNKGYASGNNIGLRYAFEHGYKYAWILNNDIIIDDRNVLPEMIRVFNCDDKIAVVNPDVYSPSGYMFNRYSKRMSCWDYTFGHYSYKKKGRHLDLKDGYGYIWRPQGCCMVVDLNKISSIGYLDENTFLYCEELILADRLISAGYKLACACGVKIIHNHSTTVNSIYSKKEKIKVHNRSFEYYLKEYRKYNFFKIKLCLLFAYLEIRFSN